MPEQPRLFRFLLEDRSAAALVIGESNRAAWEQLNRWREWPAGALVLTGPQGAGKSHMALAWAETHRAGVCWPQDRALDVFERFGGRVMIDDADAYPDEPHLALLLDAARARAGSAVLLVAAQPQERWPTRLRDLRSRLTALPSVALGEPDDALLAALLARLCRARFIKLTEKAGTYLVAHMERSFAGAQAVVEAIDRTHVRGARPVSIWVAVKALQSIRGDAPGPRPEDAAFDALPEDK